MCPNTTGCVKIERERMFSAALRTLRNPLQSFPPCPFHITSPLSATRLKLRVISRLMKAGIHSHVSFCYVVTHHVLLKGKCTGRTSINDSF